MPITLGCPSCGKRFRARDESAGKRVKCPYCAAAVPVPTAEEAATSGAATSVLPPASPPSSGPMPPKSGTAMPASVATPEDWGAASQPAAEPERKPYGGTAAASPPPPALPDRRGTKPVAKPAAKPVRQPATPKSPEQVTAAAWRKCRGGLFWVLFGLLLFTIPGFVGFGKMVYTRSVGDLPKGEGWVSIPGYVNDDNAAGAVRMSKQDQIDAGLYVIPVLLGGLCLGFGRLTAGAAPRSSGAGGMFACSGLFTILALASLVTAAACQKLLFNEIFLYTGLGFMILAGLAEFWFLTGLTASGLALRRPSVARAVGLVGFMFALTAAIPTVGWMAYTDPSLKLRPSPLDDDWKFYEQISLMIGWLLLIGVYWRAVRGVRIAIRDHLDGATA